MKDQEPTWHETRPPFGEFGQLEREGDRVRCHVCGDWFEHLGSHTAHKHGLTADEYRQAFGLAQKTKLVGDRFRQIRRRQALEQGLADLGDQDIFRNMTAEQRSANARAAERRVQHRRNTTEPERVRAALRARGLTDRGYSDRDYARWAKEYVDELAARDYAYGTYAALGRRWGITGLAARARIHTAAERGLLAWQESSNGASLTTKAARLLDL